MSQSVDAEVYTVTIKVDCIVVAIAKNIRLI